MGNEQHIHENNVTILAEDFTLKMFALGAGALPIIGTAEQVAEQLARLYELGMDGVLIEFLHYHDDTVRFGEEIVPLLRQLGTVE